MTGATVANSPSTGINNVGAYVFNAGTTTVTYTAYDAAGNYSSCSYTVTVTDNINPTLACQSNVSVNVALGICTQSVTTTDPTTADNCSVTKLTWAMTGATVFSSAPTGINNVGTYTFNLGVTTVTYTVYDAAGNSATCAYTVTVSDNINPTITAPATIYATTNSGCTATGVSLGAPTTADNCSVYSVTNDAPTAFPLGNTTVTWTVTDGSNNTATATQTVTVMDNVNPTITAPADISVCDGSTIILGTSITADNCTVYSVTNDAPGSFTVGVTTVTWTVTDGSSNTATATQTVTVNPLPTVGALAIPSQTICAGTMVTLSGAGAATYVWTGGVNDGIGFIPTTTTTFTVTGTDGNSCSSTSTITITLNPAPIANAGADQTICFGDTATLSGTGGITYLWTDGTNTYTTSTIQESPSATTSYALTVSDNSGCTASDTALIVVVPSKDIYGHVVYSGGNVINGSVVIYHYKPFQTLFDTVQVAQLNTSGDYHFTSINHGNYLIKVFSDTTIYPTLVATYYGNAYLWNDSSVIVINHNCTIGDTLNSITMIEQIGIGAGPGFITGQVIEGPSFGRNLGDPIPGVDVNLGKNPGGSVMKITTTNSTGTYTFSGVPYGNYTIYIDIPGLGRDSSYTFSVDSSHNQFLHLDYIADSNSVYINPNSTTGIKTLAILDENKFWVYPNPSNGTFTIATKESEYLLIITNILGENIYQSEIKNPQSAIDLSKQPNGVYFLNIKTGKELYIKKIIMNK
jgi:hypothetical protein